MIDADKTRLIAAVAARLKIRLDENDPAFVIVELNRLVLEQTVRDALQRVREFGPALQRFPGDQAAADFAALVAQRVVAKLAETEKRTSGPAIASAYAWTTALACTLVLMLFAATIGYLLGVAHAGWQELLTKQPKKCGGRPTGRRRRAAAFAAADTGLRRQQGLPQAAKAPG